MTYRRPIAIIAALAALFAGMPLLLAAPAAAQTPTVTPTATAVTFAPCPNVTVTVSPPTAAAPTTVTVAISPAVNLQPGASGDVNSFHLHYFIDTPAASAGTVIPSDNPLIIHSAATTQHLGALAPGQHTVNVVLGQLHHVACAARGSVTFTVAAQQSVTAITAALQSAMDRGDVAAALALVTEDISVEGIGLCAATPCVGKNAVRPEFQRRVDARIQRVRLSEQVTGNTVTTNFEVRDDNTRRCNVERILLSETNEVRGTLVATQRVRLDLTDPQTAALRACQLAAAAAAAAAPAAPAPPKTGNAGFAATPPTALAFVMLLATAALTPFAARTIIRR